MLLYFLHQHSLALLLNHCAEVPTITSNVSKEPFHESELKLHVRLIHELSITNLQTERFDFLHVAAMQYVFSSM